MKTKFSFLMVCMFAALININAQGGGGQRKTVEERVKTVMEKLTPLTLDKDQTDKTNVVFTDYYKAADKKRDEMMAGGQPDRDKMREEMQKMNGERDEKLKKIFNADQYKKFKDEIETTLRPQRPPGSGGNQ